MQPEAVERVLGSWAALEGRQEQLVDHFYSRLFELDPGLKRLFVITDMELQHQKFADTLRMLLRYLAEPDTLGREARRSGARHADYGVRRMDYRTAGEALLWALQKELGEAFTDEVRDAWAEAYTVLSHEMARGGSGSPAP